MANGAPTDTTEKKPEGTTPASPPPAKDPPAKEPVVAKEPAAKEPKEPKESKEPKTGGEERKRVALKGDDDELPDDADLFELTPRALKSRLTRHTKKEIKAIFGTDDVDEIMAKQKRLEALEQAEKKREEETLSATQKLEKERDTEKARADAAEIKARDMAEQRVFDKQENRLTRIADKFLDSDYIEDNLPKLAKWLKRNFTKVELKTLKDKDIQPFFENLIEKKPKLAKDYDPEKAKPKKVPADNSVKNNERPAAKGSGEGAEKTFAPGKPNSMSREEARAAMRKEGYSY